MLTASVASYFKILQAQKSLGPESVLQQVNSQMTQNGSESAPHLMTMLSLELDFASNTLRACFAGAPAPAILRKSGEVHFLSGTGAPLGSIDFTVETVKESFNPGDRIIVFTDGITEARKKNMDYGLRRLKQSILKTKQLPLKQSVAEIIKDVNVFVEHESLRDDLTLVVIEIKEAAVQVLAS
jgi:serine phosphatase RsbU (regulator of sigma subunit)